MAEVFKRRIICIYKNMRFGTILYHNKYATIVATHHSPAAASCCCRLLRGRNGFDSVGNVKRSIRKVVRQTPNLKQTQTIANSR